VARDSNPVSTTAVRGFSRFAKKAFPKSADPASSQTRAQFAAEQSEIDRNSPPVRWIRPSDGDPDVVSFEASPVTPWERTEEVIVRVILHRLMEEFITGELKPDAEAVRARGIDNRNAESIHAHRG
jgi:CRISPR-associated exonuclease Cas4